VERGLGGAATALALVLAACGAGGGDDATGATAAIAGGHVGARAVAVIDEPLILNDVLSHGEVVIGLASRTMDLEGGVVVRSEDGGVSWTTAETPLADALAEGPFSYWEIAPDRPALRGDGGWVVATRTAPVAPGSFFAVQAVAISDDVGVTWEAVELPAPDGTVGLVHAAAAVGGDLLLGGAVQELPSADEPPLGGQEAFEQRRAAYDAAIWRVAADGTVTREAEVQFDGRPDAQAIRYLEVVDDRVVAFGGDAAGRPLQCCFLDLPPATWSSSDGGETWASLPGLSESPTSGLYEAPTRDGGALVLQVGIDRLRLEPGGDRWGPVVLPEEQWPDAKAVSVGADEEVLTWVEDVACDCAEAMGGRVGAGEVTDRVPLELPACADTSPRGFTRVERPIVMGGVVVALAYCDHHGGHAVGLAWTADAGRSWDTTRLTDLASTIGAEDLYLPYGWPEPPILASGDEVLVLLSAPSAGPPSRRDGRPEPAPLAAVHLRPEPRRG